MRTRRLQGASLRALWKWQQIQVCSLAFPRSRPCDRIRSLRISWGKCLGSVKGERRQQKYSEVYSIFRPQSVSDTSERREEGKFDRQSLTLQCSSKTTSPGRREVPKPKLPMSRTPYSQGLVSPLLSCLLVKEGREKSCFRLQGCYSPNDLDPF